MSDTALLSIEHLKKAYGDNVVLKDISLSVKRGEVIVVIGPSGCGKSTFLRCINALEPIQGGTIEVDGKEVTSSEKDLTELRQKVGMVFQSYDLFPHMTVLDNITLAPTKVKKIPKAQAEEAAPEARWPYRQGKELSARAFWRPEAARCHCPRVGNGARSAAT